MNLFAPNLSGRRTQSDYWGPPCLVAIFGIWASSAVIGFQPALGLATMFGFAAAVLGFFAPSLGMIGVGVLCTLDAVTRNLLMSGGFLRYNTFNYWLCVCIVLSLPVLFKKKCIPTRLLVLLVLLMGLQLTYTSDLTNGIISLLNVVTVFGILAYLYRSLSDRRIFVWMGLINGTVAAAAGLSYFALLDTLPVLNHNAFSYLPLTGLFSICLALDSLEEGRALRIWLVILAVANSAWVFFSTSRGAILIGGICLLYMIRTTKDFSARASLALFAPILLGGTLIVFSDLQVQAATRVARLFDRSVSLESRTSGRSDLAKAAVLLFAQNPVGTGTGSFNMEFRNMNIPELSFSGMDRNAHSGWLKVLVENGVIGFILLTGFVVSFSIVGWKKRQAGLLPFGLWISLILSSNYVSREFQAKGPWLLVASGIVLLSERRKHLILEVRDGA